MKRRIIALLLVTTSLAFAQTQTPPSTKLEAAVSQVGGLTLRQTFGEQEFPGELGGGSVTFEALRVTIPETSASVQGVRISVNPYQQAGRVTFIDFEDLANAIKALDYIIKNSASLDVKLQPELAFTSKSGLEIGVSPAQNPRAQVFVSSGPYTVFFDANQLKIFRSTLATYQASLK